MILKCKMCGGDLDIQPGMSVATCLYCGTKQTIPNMENEKTANLFDRANHFRRNNEFDKALGIYEQILDSGVKDCEAYWSVVLCKYGIEYVEDPKDKRRIPTVNRTSLVSVYDDTDYKAAIELADAEQKKVYEAEAKEIDRIQKDILKISMNEEPFDIFICYKETDNNGRRTSDSVLAYDIYEALTKEGYRVFFSRVTLEDKLGTAYEPYIFAALTSAKVMIAVGTRREYYDAVWVKNEWGRYLASIKNGEEKTLIPVYRDMDPYDLPDEFSHLQGLDMEKLGAMQDLIRGIKKILTPDSASKDIPSEQKSIQADMPYVKTENLIKRAWIFIEDNKWNDARKYVNDVLDADASNAEAYLLMFMINHKLKDTEDIPKSGILVSKDSDYTRALRYAKGELKKKLEEIEAAQRFSEQEKKYKEANKLMNSKLPHKLLRAKKLFSVLGDYQESAGRLKDVSKRFRRCVLCYVLVVIIATGGAGGTVYYRNVVMPQKQYMEAQNLLDQKEYDEAKAIFESLGDYEDAAEKIKRCDYDKAMSLYGEGKYDAAKEIFGSLDSYEDADSKIQDCDYNRAVALYEAKSYDAAKAVFESLHGFKDSDDMALKSEFEASKNLLFDQYKPSDYKKYVDNKDLHDEAVAWLKNEAETLTGKMVYGDADIYIYRCRAIDCLTAAGFLEYSDEIKEVRYQYVCIYYNNDSLDEKYRDFYWYKVDLGEDLLFLTSVKYGDAPQMYENLRKPYVCNPFYNAYVNHIDVDIYNMSKGYYIVSYPDGKRVTRSFTAHMFEDAKTYSTYSLPRMREDDNYDWWEKDQVIIKYGTTVKIDIYQSNGQLVNSCELTYE